ncbi:hypothetical protein [Catenuloplanes japonicus]|uniref:hypothetical protein n=1 Tax=Catenuloplanes japonicus TaxID=33876 RepID=UPI000A67E943|nr:hypothetical protein [Catenuloplanes japonicus]
MARHGWIATDAVYRLGMGAAAYPAEAIDMTVPLSPVAMPLVNPPEFLTRG